MRPDASHKPIGCSEQTSTEPKPQESPAVLESKTGPRAIAPKKIPLLHKLSAPQHRLKSNHETIACLLPLNVGNLDGMARRSWIKLSWFIGHKGPRMAGRCQRVILVCMPELTPLFATIEEIDEIKPPGEIGLKEFDVYVPLMSLPYLFETTADTTTIPYLAVPESYLHKHPLPATDRLKVGIAWGGSPTHKNDRHRACFLTNFLPILQTPGIDFYSLQKGDRTSELKDLPPEIKIADLSEQLQDYGDTAAIIGQLDLVISVDTSVVHLAGAKGKTVWTLLCFNADWRWMVTSEESPWYPTMKLFRQSQPDDWHSVFAQVRDALSKY